MFESLPVVLSPALIAALVGCVLVLILILAMLRYRQAALSPEWQEAKQYADVKGLAPDQWLVLAAMLKRYAADSPYEALTYRHEYDRCVREQIDAITGTSQREKMGELLREIRDALGLDTVPEGAHWTSTLDLEEKKKISARPADEASCPMREFYIKRVNDAYFYLAPRKTEMVADVSPGSGYLIHACHDGDARYEIVAEVAAIRSNPVRLMFGHVFEMKRLQMRAHERSAYTRPASIELFVMPEEWINDPLTWLYQNEPVRQGSGTFMNLSAGGFAAMLLDSAPPTNAYARVTITLGDKYMPPFTVFAHIVDTVALASDRTLLRAAFADITPTQQEAIDSYVADTKRQNASETPKPDEAEQAQ